MGDQINIPKKARGIRLCKVNKKEELILCEPVLFKGGCSAVFTVFSRAAISGKVGPVGETGDFWADILDENGDWFETISLDRKSWNSLKSKWAKCKVITTKAGE